MSELDPQKLSVREMLLLSIQEQRQHRDEFKEYCETQAAEKKARYEKVDAEMASVKGRIRSLEHWKLGLQGAGALAAAAVVYFKDELKRRVIG